MRYLLRGRRVPVPNITTGRSQPQPIDYNKGWANYAPNDIQPKETLRYVTDARFEGVGQYKTRKGCDTYSVPIGEAVNVQVTSTTGAADQSFSTSTWLGEKLTATATGKLTKVDVRLKNDAAATGTVMVAVYSDNAGVPGTLLARSSIANSSISGSYTYISARFIEAPTITNTSVYWVVVYIQAEGTGSYKISSTTNSTNAKTSSDAGANWSSASYSLNAKLYTSTAGGVKGLTRIYRPNGTAVTIFAHGVNVYTVNDSTGATTSIDSGLNASSTEVRFDYVNDVLYYTDGYSKPRKYDFATASEVSTAPNSARNILEHVGVLFYFDATDPTKAFFTNFADYETFTSTDFLYVPAPKKADGLTAMAKLNGVLYFFTQRNKHALLGQDNATFNLGEANAQKGTYSQESVVWDANYIYFASDDGIYQFNGTYEKNIAEPILTTYTELLDKSNCVLELHNNRLYVWYTPNGEADNKQCFVYNTLLGVWESLDTQTHIGRAFARKDNEELFLQASNKVGAVYYGEQSTNDYTNLGEIMQMEVRTAYDHFGAPQQIKRVTYWRPIIQSVQGNYSLQAGFAADYSDDFQFSNVALQGSGYTYDSASALYDTATYAAPATAIDTTLELFGEAYRWQRVYKHHAAREPIEFSGEVLKIQIQRLR